MYYRGVNRGVNLTSPGRYTIALLLTLGIVAIASGYNGIYLSISMGFSIVIISGLLSEKVMKYYEVQSLADTTAEPGTPFSLPFRAVNNHSSLVIYGIENLLFTEAPQFKLLSGSVPALMRSTVLNLAPGTTREWSGTCVGLPRGLYREFVMVQRTFYPFGLLVKFKLSRVPVRVSIPPKINQQLAAELREELRGRLATADDPREFHSHRPYTTKDSLRHVDWKKSAGLESRSWVLKMFESIGEDLGLLIEFNGRAVSELGDAEAYEAALSNARTACEVGREAGRVIALQLDGKHPIFGFEACLRTLVEAPQFKDRALGFQAAFSAEKSFGNYIRLRLSSGSHHWDAEPCYLSVG